jgi:hypothetical protein
MNEASTLILGLTCFVLVAALVVENMRPRGSTKIDEVRALRDEVAKATMLLEAHMRRDLADTPKPIAMGTVKNVPKATPKTGKARARR